MSTCPYPGERVKELECELESFLVFFHMMLGESGHFQTRSFLVRLKLVTAEPSK